MNRRAWGHAAVAALVVAPFAAVLVYGAVGIVASATAWELDLSEPVGEAHPVRLRPGVVYRLVLTTACFTGSDLAVHLAAWSDEAGVLAANAQGRLYETRHACRSAFESRGFTVREGGNYTVGWSLSAEVLAHAPHLLLIEKMMTFFDAMDFVAVGLIGGLWACPFALALFGWLKGRPPKGKSPVSRPLTRSAPASS